MASEQRRKTRAADHAGTTPDDEAPWADLEMAVPTDRDHASVVALVECALVELTHETVGAVFVAHQVGRSTRTQSVARDDVGEQFQKRHVDDPFKTSASPSSRGRHRHEPTGCGPNGNRPQLHRQIGDALETPRPSA